MESVIHDLSTKIAAYGKMIEFFYELKDLGYEGSDGYIGLRIHKLNCVYADLQVKRLCLIEDNVVFKSE